MSVRMDANEQLLTTTDATADAGEEDKEGEEEDEKHPHQEEDEDDLSSRLEDEIRQLSWSEVLHEWIDAARYNDLDIMKAIYQHHQHRTNDPSVDIATTATSTSTSSTTSPSAKATAITTNTTAQQLRRLVDAHDAHGNTALHMASANGHVPVVQWLLQHGARSTRTNHVGNTPLHWAAANGQPTIVAALLSSHHHPHPEGVTINKDDDHEEEAKAKAEAEADIVVDVLQRNHFGRSVLTEGFQSDNTDVVKALLEHSSADEERLIHGGGGGGGATSSVAAAAAAGKEGEAKVNQPSMVVIMDEENNNNDECDALSTHSATTSMIQSLILGGSVHVRVREIAMATDDRQCIVGQDKSLHDRTGLSIWSSSIVASHWMSYVNVPDFVSASTTTSRPPIILEVGAGCAVPSLVLAHRVHKQQLFVQDELHNSGSDGPDDPIRIPLASSSSSPCVYASDWNQEVLDNISFNIKLNEAEDVASPLFLDWNYPEHALLHSSLLSNNNNNNNNNNNISEESSSPVNKVDDDGNDDDDGSKGVMMKDKPTIIVGADLIYEPSMIERLVNVIVTLLNRNDERARFYYVAPHQQQPLPSSLYDSSLQESTADPNPSSRQQPEQRNGGLEFIHRLQDELRLVQSHTVASAFSTSLESCPRLRQRREGIENCNNNNNNNNSFKNLKTLEENDDPVPALCEPLSSQSSSSSSFQWSSLLANPLVSQDEEECFLQFQQLQTGAFDLYEFAWR